MMQNDLTTVNPIDVGEEINKDLAAKMVKEYNDAFPNDIKDYLIGRTIIEAILKQPRCAGIKFYNAINEQGIKTLVYVGVDEKCEILSRFTYINGEGKMSIKQAIVADRVRTSPTTDEPILNEWW